MLAVLEFQITSASAFTVFKCAGASKWLPHFQSSMALLATLQSSDSYSCSNFLQGSQSPMHSFWAIVNIQFIVEVVAAFLIHSAADSLVFWFYMQYIYLIILSDSASRHTDVIST